MKKHEILFSLLKIPFDFLIVFGSFFLARNMRGHYDLIPFFQLPKQTIESGALLYYAWFGAILYLIIFGIHGLYSLSITHSKLKEIGHIFQYSVYWFLFFSVFVYFGREIFYTVDIPRLVIIFTTFLVIVGVILERILFNNIQYILLEKNIIKKRKLLLITKQSNEHISHILQDIQETGVYEIAGYMNQKKLTSTLHYLGNSANIVDILTKKNIDEILFIDSDFTSEELYFIWDVSRIYGVRYRYLTNSFDVTKTNTTLSLISKIPALEIKITALSSWWRVIKRMFDFCAALFGLILCLPIFLVVGILIKLEDPSGPIFYKNIRIGQNGKRFTLYKFRYLQWKYCVKEGYGIENASDEALEFEKKLIKTSSTRHGPLYKIKDDPRKMKIGAFIEKYSIDELPQLFNVLLGNMSLVGPRPHQPREVEQYQLSQKRVLTIKPGITGLAQVNGREKNTFEDEVKLDIFYIENWSFLLDGKIFLKTFHVLFNRK